MRSFVRMSIAVVFSCLKNWYNKSSTQAVSIGTKQYLAMFNAMMSTYSSSASKYFCLRISKYIFMEYLLSSRVVKPLRYRSTSSHFPWLTRSSKCCILKRKPDSCSNLQENNNEYFCQHPHRTATSSQSEHASRSGSGILFQASHLS